MLIAFEPLSFFFFFFLKSDLGFTVLEMGEVGPLTPYWKQYILELQCPVGLSVMVGMV